MKPRNCLALVVTSVLAIGCASAQAQDGKDVAPAPAPQGPPGQDGPRDELPPEVREAVRQGQEKIRAAADRVREAEKRVADAKAAASGPDDAALKDATSAADEARKALDEAKVEQMKRMVEVEAVRQQHDEMRPGPGGRDGRGDDRMRRRAMGGMGRDDRGPGGPGPSVEERLAQIERAVREMREMFERHGVPQDARERGEREMRERRGDGPPRGDDRGPRGGMGFGGGEPRPMGPGDRPGEPQGPDMRPEGPGRPPVPRPPNAAREEALGKANDMNYARVRELETKLQEVVKALNDSQEALKKAQAELEALKAKK